MKPFNLKVNLNYRIWMMGIDSYYGKVIDQNHKELILEISSGIIQIEKNKIWMVHQL